LAKFVPLKPYYLVTVIVTLANRYHMSLHDGVADFLCDDCGKGFVTRQKLTNHRRSKHTFEKPYICDQCGQGFIRSDKLTVHKRRAHTGEKPYQVEAAYLQMTETETSFCM